MGICESHLDSPGQHRSERGDKAESGNVRFGSKANVCEAKSHCRFTVESGHPRLGVVIYRLFKSDTQNVAVRFQGTLQTEISADGLVNELPVLNGHLG